MKAVLSFAAELWGLVADVRQLRGTLQRADAQLRLALDDPDFKPEALPGPRPEVREALENGAAKPAKAKAGR